jgi:sulfur-carrier protein
LARVSSIAQQVREFTGGIDQFDMPASSVRALIAALDARFPGLGQHVSDHMAMAIDGELHQDAHNEALAVDCEVVLIPKISGG